MTEVTEWHNRLVFMLRESDPLIEALSVGEILARTKGNEITVVRDGGYIAIYDRLPGPPQPLFNIAGSKPA